MECTNTVVEGERVVTVVDSQDGRQDALLISLNLQGDGVF